MITFLPQDSSRPLTETIRPSGWENLSGSFAWYSFESENAVEHPDYGYVFHIRIHKNKIGTLVRHFMEHKSFPARVYMLSGPPGTGKTTMNELMARTHLAKEHEPVGWRTPEGQLIPFIDVESGNTIPINPVDKDGEMVRRVMSMPGETGNMQMSAWNAGQMAKKDIDELINNLRKDTSLTGRRVCIISEIDNIRHDQSASLRVGLDPLNVPEGLLVLSDTNHLDKARKNMGDAGLRRFTVIPIANWPHADLLVFAQHYQEHYNIQYDLSTFESETEPLDLLVKRANGAIRELIRGFEQVREHGAPITKEELHSLITDQEDVSFDGQADAYTYFTGATTGKVDIESVLGYIRPALRRQTSLGSFTDSLAQYMLRYCPDVFQQETVGEAFTTLAELAGQDGRPIYDTVWAAAFQPLYAVAQAIDMRYNPR